MHKTRQRPDPKPYIEKAEEAALVAIVEPETPELHNCGKCGGKATGAYKDRHGLYRCSCSECGYWDAVISHTPEEAESRWQGSMAKSYD